MRSDKSRRRFVFLCVAPATILFFLFMILPTLNVFRMSLYERGAYSPNETFVGLKNFQHLLKDAQFIRSMQNMILLVVVVTIVTFAFALVFAAILTREKIKGQNFFRVIFYIPNILSVVVISGIFSAIYKPENGMLNSIIGLFRDMTDPILWKGEKLVIPSIILAMVWQAVGYYMVMYMASMSSVPASLYESANLDGAGRLTQFFQITIPLIWTNIRTTLTFFIISTINLSFLLVNAMTGGGPDGAFVQVAGEVAGNGCAAAVAADVDARAPPPGGQQQPRGRSDLVSRQSRDKGRNISQVGFDGGVCDNFGHGWREAMSCSVFTRRPV